MSSSLRMTDLEEAMVAGGGESLPGGGEALVDRSRQACVPVRVVNRRRGGASSSGVVGDDLLGGGVYTHIMRATDRAKRQAVPTDPDPDQPFDDRLAVVGSSTLARQGVARARSARAHGWIDGSIQPLILEIDRWGEAASEPRAAASEQEQAPQQQAGPQPGQAGIGTAVKSRRRGIVGTFDGFGGGRARRVRAAGAV